jgi:hypothetical protein
MGVRQRDIPDSDRAFVLKEVSCQLPVLNLFYVGSDVRMIADRGNSV